jgi:hypothetical protein
MTTAPANWRKLPSGRWVNLDSIKRFYIYQTGEKTFDIQYKFATSNYEDDDGIWNLKKDLPTEEEAQTYLDAFMRGEG